MTGRFAKVVFWTIGGVVDVGATRRAKEFKAGIASFALTALVTREPRDDGVIVGAGILETALARATVAVGLAGDFRGQHITGAAQET